VLNGRGRSFGELDATRLICCRERSKLVNRMLVMSRQGMLLLLRSDEPSSEQWAAMFYRGRPVTMLETAA
jgi:hypothetical protein